MTEKKDYKRWYDLDPTVSMAVNFMKNANEDLQLDCAQYIIDKAQSYGIKITTNELSEFVNVFRRWYDKNKQVHDALEYLRMSPYDVQLGISLDLIEKIEQSQSSKTETETETNDNKTE